MPSRDIRYFFRFIPEITQKVKAKIYPQNSLARVRFRTESVVAPRDVCTSASKRTIVYNSPLEAISAIISAHKEQEVSLKSVIVRRRQCVEIRAGKKNARGTETRWNSRFGAISKQEQRSTTQGREKENGFEHARGREESVEHP